MSLAKSRMKAAEALQRLCFRAQQQNGFVRIEDCMAVTDLITVAVIESFSEFILLEQGEEKNEHVAH